MDKQGWTSLAGFIAAALAPLYLLNLYNHWIQIDPLTPSWIGVLGLVSIWGFYTLITGSPAIWNAVRGEDGRASTSKFQAFVWTGAVFFAYIAVVAAHGLPAVDGQGATSSLPALHPNILAALGISLGTTVGAAAVTTNATNTGRVSKATPPTPKGMSPIFTNDADQPDLGKIQLLMFTFIAVGVFLGQVLQSLSAAGATATLPDIDPSLAALTGLGSAVYLGGKLATSATPWLSSRNPGQVSVSAAAKDRIVTIQGVNLGTDPTQIQAYVNDQLMQSGVTMVQGGVSFELPPKRNDGTDWVTVPPANVANLTIAVGGRTSNALNITLIP